MNQSYIVKAQVLNVTDQNGISVYYNGISRSFTYDAFNKQVSFTANLNLGSNTISMTANNTVGEDTKITEVIYRVNKPTGDPPIVNLINPASQINATDNSLYNFRLAVLNVTAKSDIEVVFNGVTQTNFVYNSTTKIIDFQSNLIVGNNILYVKGTNQFGIDSKQISVNYTPHPDIKTPPLVTIINPLGSTAAINSPNYNFKATITNIATSSGLVVKFNGNIITNFSYDGLNLSYQATLIQGSNSIEIAATNNDGSDIKNANVIYKVKVVPVFPIVNLINPSSEINATDNILYNFKLAVLNVTAKSDIEVLLNGIAQTNFTYNTTSKEIDFQTNLIEGNNTLSVKGTNQFGFDIKQISVNYTPHADLKTPPIITFVNPINTTASSQNLNYIFSATIINMPSNNGLTVTYNGNMITNYTYDGLNLVYNSTLNIGANTLVILASNSDGNDTKTAVVNYKSKIIAKPPVVSIEHPIGTPTVNTLSYNFQFSALNVTQNQIEVTLNGLPITNFNFILPQGSFTSNLVQGQNIFSVKATNVDGTITKTENIFLVLPTDTSVTIAIDTTIGNSGNDKIIICHIPPGNNQNPQTITIPQSAWNAHNAHGDTKGACPLKITNPIIVNPKVVPNLNLQNENSPIKGKIDTINKQPINTPRRPR